MHGMTDLASSTAAGLLRLQMVPIGGRTQGKLHLFEPAAQVHEKALHVRNDELVLRDDPVQLLPRMHEGVEFLPQAPAFRQGRNRRERLPRILRQRCLADLHLFGVHEIADGRAPRIDGLLPQDYFEITEGFGQAQDAVRAIGFEHDGKPGQLEGRRADVHAIGGLAENRASCKPPSVPFDDIAAINYSEYELLPGQPGVRGVAARAEIARAKSPASAPGEPSVADA